MFCGKCGTENKEEIRFCIKCGSNLAQQTPPERKSGEDAKPSDSMDDGKTYEGPEVYPSEFETGSLFANRYEILEEGKKGGMGAVYKCQDTKLNSVVALKIIHPRLVESNKAVLRFRQEVAISRDLQHPNIVRVYNLEEWEGNEYFTMEWVEGVTLREVIEQRKKESKPFSLDEVSNIISQLADALHYAHEYTIHRDIKPENVLIHDAGGPIPDAGSMIPDKARAIPDAEEPMKDAGFLVQVKLTDFGIAKMLSPSEFTSTSIQMGTPYYMAPEQKLDAASVDKRADIYALGVVLFELLTLENTIGLKLPSEINEELPKGIDSILKKALESKPSDRYGEISELSRLLKKIVAQGSSGQEQSEIKHSRAERGERKDSSRQKRSIKSKLAFVAVIIFIIVISVELLIKGPPGCNETLLIPTDEPEETAKELKPVSPELAAELDASVLIEKGDAQARLGNYSEATKRYKEAKALFPTLDLIKKILDAESKLADMKLKKQEAEKITTLLSRADEQLKRQKYTSPEGDNAFSTIKEIQRLDPTNQKAKFLVTRMRDDYMTWGGEALDVSDYTKAKSYYEKALLVSPGYSPAKAKFASCDRKLEELASEWARQEEEVRQQEEERKREEEKRKKATAGMVFVKGGCYEMGCGNWTSNCSRDEKPLHEVCVDDFYIDKLEVTQIDFERVVNKNPSKFKGSNNPVEKVTWYEANEYCGKVGKRLLTEAEWEYAARSGGKREKYAGTSSILNLSDYAWHRYNSGDRHGTFLKSHPVGQKKPNGLGLYDMSGNVMEWCSDWYDNDYYSQRVKENPNGPGSGKYRVMRGGAWVFMPWYGRTSDRYMFYPDKRADFAGFRCSKSP